MASYESNLDPDKKVIVKGVKGMKSKPFTKKFKNMAAYEKWTDSDEFGDFEVQQVMNESLSNLDKALSVLREEKVPTYSRSKVKQMIKDGKCEVNTGDIDTARSGSHIELRMFPSKKVKTVMIESESIDPVFKAACDDIAEMTSDNEHSKALVAGAKLISGYSKDAKELITKFKDIATRHHMAGHLSKKLSDERSSYADKLFTLAKKVLSPEEFKLFNSSY